LRGYDEENYKNSGRVERVTQPRFKRDTFQINIQENNAVSPWYVIERHEG
jgi:hypothetical protein